MKEDALTYDSTTDRYYVDFAVEEPNSVVDAVVHGVAEIVDRDPVTLTPLDSVVDTDSLSRIFHTAGDADSGVSVSFEYTGVSVIVHGHGRISFEERD